VVGGAGGGAVPAGWSVPVGAAESSDAGGVQWPIAACSGEQAAAGMAGGGVVAPAAGWQWPIAACSAEQAAVGDMSIAGIADAAGFAARARAGVALRAAGFAGAVFLGAGLFGAGFLGAVLAGIAVPGIFIPCISCICAAAGVAVTVARKKASVFMMLLPLRHRGVR
jgi:hypothetical protein